MPLRFEGVSNGLDPCHAVKIADRLLVVCAVKLVHPALHNANLSTLIPGEPVVLAAPHAKVRRDGYRVVRPPSRGVSYDVPERESSPGGSSGAPS